MIVIGHSNNRKKFYVQMSKEELEVLLGRSLYYASEVDSIMNKRLDGVIDIFRQNKASINDLNYKKESIKRDLQKMIENIDNVGFLIPKEDNEICVAHKE